MAAYILCSHFWLLKFFTNIKYYNLNTYMMKIVFIEGPDRIGKSTLVDYLTNSIDNCYRYKAHTKIQDITSIDGLKSMKDFYEIRHIGHIDQMKSDILTLSEIPLLSNHTFVFDRFHISGYVYPKILRPNSINNIFGSFTSMIEYNQNFEEYIQKLNVQVYLFTFTVKSPYNPIEDDFVREKEKQIEINSEYLNYFNHHTKIKKKFNIQVSQNESQYCDTADWFPFVSNTIKSF